jgi:hypothetical protein
MFSESSTEKKEATKTFSFSFSEKGVGNSPESLALDTDGLVGFLNKWYDQKLEESGINSSDKLYSLFGYYVIELAKNALEYANGGEITVTFSEDELKVVVRDLGESFRNPNRQIFDENHDHGLYQVIQYADEFEIEEPAGTFYKDQKNPNFLLFREQTSVLVGKKIVLKKSLKEK